MIKKICILILISCHGHAQFKNNVWCFGDSAGIRFDQGSAQTFTSSALTRGGSCSISDSTGNLLFYSTTDYYPLWQQGYLKLGVVFDKNHILMQNGDTLMGSLLYQEQVIIPFPNYDSLFYLFNVGVVFPYGLYFSIIDISQNSGLGAVVQKNIQINNLKANDCINAVKHGNGRDWWLLFRNWDTVNNSYYKYLVTPGGVSPPVIQNIGTLSDNNLMHSSFSRDGSKYMIVDYRGLIEVYNFDRCTGVLDSVITIEQEQPFPFPNYFGCEFAPDGRFIYVSTVDDSITYLYQFDLQAGNISASKIAIDSVQSPSFFGMLRLAPDNKIYCAHNYWDGINPYPYIDSLNNMYNENLSVINFPDSVGVACGFSPFSFYLGGNETRWGLPNNPDYSLGPLVGSPCDTLTTGLIPALSGGEGVPTLHAFYHASWQTAFINAQKLKGKNFVLHVYDITGKEVFKETGKLNSQYYTKNLNCTAFSKGMYVVSLRTEKERLVKKFVKE